MPVAPRSAQAELTAYEVVDRLGAGGTGMVSRATHRDTGSVVALKTLQRSDPASHEQLRRAIAILLRLAPARHAGVVHLVDHGATEGAPWYAMELIDGQRLDSWIRDGEQPLSTLLSVFASLARALAFIHDEGIVHGDVTPRNVLLHATRGPVLVDFGSARLAQSRESATAGQEKVGTPGYMAPEQILGLALDARCDLYALGAMLYEALTGRPVFVADSSAALLAQHLNVSPDPPSRFRRDIPAALDALILRMLDKERGRRTGYAQQIAAALEALGGDPPAATSIDTATPRNVRLFRTRFVGRQAELAALHERLLAARAGATQLVFVAGESGVGKTRLINELSALSAPFETVVGSCAELTPEPVATQTLGSGALRPFAPLLHCSCECWHQLAASGSEREALAQHLAALVPYEPALAGLIGDIEQDPPPAGELARARVLRALAACIAAIGRWRPLLLVLDDLHWADDLTLAFLDFCQGGGLAGVPVMLLATYRVEQCPARLAALIAASGGPHLRLARLGLDDVRALVSDMIGTSDAPPGLAEFVQQHAEGNPFFVNEYLRATLERGLVDRDDIGSWSLPKPFALTTSRGISEHLPASVRGLIELRTAGLGLPARQLLEFAATVGPQFSLERLERLTGDSGLVSTTRLALDELIARQIIEEPAPGQFRFAHAKLREASQLSLPEFRRRELHERIALQLEAERDTASAGERLDAEIGTHWAAAGEPRRALTALERAGAYAVSVHAHADAIQLYSLALRQAELIGDLSHAVAINEALGDVLERSARHIEAREQYQLALGALPRDERLHRARLRRKSAQSLWTLHQYAPAHEAIEQAEAELGGDADTRTAEEHGEWIEIQRCRFFLLYFSRQVGPATEALIARMAQIVPRYGDSQQRSSYFQCAAMEVMARTRYQHTAEAIAFAHRSVAEVEPVRQLAIQRDEARFTLGLALALGGAAECKQAAALLEQTAQSAARAGNSTLVARCLVYLAMAHRRLGDPVRTRAIAEEALRASDAAHLSPYNAAATASLAWVAWREGNTIAARRLAEEARARWASGPHAFPFRWQASFVLLELIHDEEELSELWAVLDELLDPQQQGFPSDLQQALAELAGHRASPDHTTVTRTFARVRSMIRQCSYL